MNEKRIDLEQLAVMFRCDDPNLGHVSVLGTMTEAGLAYTYGLFRAIPKAHRRKRRQMMDDIANRLDRRTKELFPA